MNPYLFRLSPEQQEQLPREFWDDCTRNDDGTFDCIIVPASEADLLIQSYNDMLEQ